MLPTNRLRLYLHFGDEIFAILFGVPRRTAGWRAGSSKSAGVPRCSQNLAPALAVAQIGGKVEILTALHQEQYESGSCRFP